MIFNAAKELGQLSKLKVRMQRIPGTAGDRPRHKIPAFGLDTPSNVGKSLSDQRNRSFAPHRGNSRLTVSKLLSALPT